MKYTYLQLCCCVLICLFLTGCSSAKSKANVSENNTISGTINLLEKNQKSGQEIDEVLDIFMASYFPESPKENEFELASQDTSDVHRGYSQSILVSSDVINRFLQMQVGLETFPLRYEIESNGNSIEIVSSQPYVRFLEGELRLVLDLLVVVGNRHYRCEIEPRLMLPSGSFSVSDLKALLVDVERELKDVDMPIWIKSEIINRYENLQVSLIPDTILSKANVSYLNQTRLTVSDVSVAWAIEAENVELTFTIELDITDKFNIARLYYAKNSLTVVPFVEATLRRIEVYSSNNTLVAKVTPHKKLKKGESFSMGIKTLSFGVYFVVSVYQTDTSYFVLEYQYAYVGDRGQAVVSKRDNI